MAIDDPYTKLLLHCNGANASTVFTDEAGKTVTAVNGAKLDTSVKKFGTASGVFVQSNKDYLSIPASSDFSVGAGNFTIDFWWYPVDNLPDGPVQALWSHLTDHDIGIDFNRNTRNICVWASSNGVTWDIIDGADGTPGKGLISLSFAAWSHVAVVRNGNNWMSFINGVKDIDATAAGTVKDLSALDAYIGQWYITSDPTLSGNIDEFRFSKGIARWTANFTPPVNPYAPNGQFLQMCRDASGR